MGRSLQSPPGKKWQENELGRSVTYFPQDEHKEIVNTDQEGIVDIDQKRSFK
jgi:hypothetical protein